MDYELQDMEIRISENDNEDQDDQDDNSTSKFSSYHSSNIEKILNENEDNLKEYDNYSDLSLKGSY